MIPGTFDGAVRLFGEIARIQKTLAGAVLIADNCRVVLGVLGQDHQSIYESAFHNSSKLTNYSRSSQCNIKAASFGLTPIGSYIIIC